MNRRDGTTAPIAANDETATGALEVFAAKGARIPHDLSLTGFDDVYPFHLFDPPLTCIRQPVEAMGRHAVELLVAGLNGKETALTVEHLPVELVSRRSVVQPRATKSMRHSLAAHAAASQGGKALGATRR